MLTLNKVSYIDDLPISSIDMKPSASMINLSVEKPPFPISPPVLPTPVLLQAVLLLLPRPLELVLLLIGILLLPCGASGVSASIPLLILSPPATSSKTTPALFLSLLNRRPLPGLTRARTLWFWNRHSMRRTIHYPRTHWCVSEPGPSYGTIVQITATLARWRVIGLSGLAPPLSSTRLNPTQIAIALSLYYHRLFGCQGSYTRLF